LDCQFYLFLKFPESNADESRKAPWKVRETFKLPWQSDRYFVLTPDFQQLGWGGWINCTEAFSDTLEFGSTINDFAVAGLEKINASSP